MDNDFPAKDSSAGYLLSIDVRLREKARGIIIANLDSSHRIKRHEVYAILCRRIKLDKSDAQELIRQLESAGVIRQDFQGIKLVEGQHG